MVNEILYADDLALISKSIKNMREKLLQKKQAFESKGLKVNLRKTKVMISGLKGEILKSKLDPFAVCDISDAKFSLRTNCSETVHNRCAEMKINEENIFKQWQIFPSCNMF